MTNAERAKIFAPYAALKGFGEYLAAQEFEPDERIILGEDAQIELDQKLRRLQIGDHVFVTYYFGMKYVTVSGPVKKINMDGKYIMIGEVKVPILEILSADMENAFHGETHYATGR